MRPDSHEQSGKDPVNPLAAHPVPDAIDVTKPHPARMYDYYLGGKDHWQADREAAEQILAVALEARAMALSHGTTDFHPADVTGTATTTYDSATAPLVLRPRAVIEALLAGFTAEPPGLVQAPLWHPDTKPKPADLKKIGIYAAVAAKN